MCNVCRENAFKCVAAGFVFSCDLVTSIVLATEGDSIDLVLIFSRLTVLPLGLYFAIRWTKHGNEENADSAHQRHIRDRPLDDLRQPLATLNTDHRSNATSSSAPSPTASMTSMTSISSTEMDQELAARAQQAEANAANQWKRTTIVTLSFIFVTAQSITTGVKVAASDDLGTHVICLAITIVCMNAEFVLLQKITEVATRSDGVTLKKLHEHPLFFHNDKKMMWCGVCRQRIGPRTGGYEAFSCNECENYHVCSLCYRKHLSQSNEEGLLRGDKGPKHLPELTVYQYVARTMRIIRPYRCVAICAVVCLLTSQVMRVLIPQYNGLIIEALIHQNRDDFQVYITYFVILNVGTALIGSIQGLAVEIIARRISLDMTTATFKSIISQDIAFFDGIMAGQLTSRMTNDVMAVVQPVRQILNVFIASIIQLIGGLLMCFWSSWKLTTVAATMIGPIIYITRVYAKWSRKLNAKIRASRGDAIGVATEAVRNIRTVRSFGADAYEVSQFQSHMEMAWGYAKKDAWASAGVAAATRYLDFAASVLILAYGGAVVLAGGRSDLNIGKLIAFNLYWNMLDRAISQLNGMLNTLIRAGSAAQRVYEVVDLQPDILLEDPTADPPPPQNCGYLIEFRDVHFTYQMRAGHKVLKGLTLEISTGQVVAIVGKSGAGKSTLASLLLRFYDPQEGTLLLNGRPLSDYRLRDYQRRVGIVNQEPQVFCRSILENIAYGLEPSDYTEDDVQAAASAANAHEFIKDFDQQYQSMVGEGGVRLSGGQKQRIAIARALLRKPSLMLLDEATSALDAENEAQVQKALDELILRRNAFEHTSIHHGGAPCSIMLIAHRLSTVMGADKIAVINEGVVCESGTHQELLEREGIYAQLVHRQLAKQANTLEESSNGPAKEGSDECRSDSGKARRGKGKGGKSNGKSNDTGARSNGPADSIDGLFGDLSSKPAT